MSMWESAAKPSKPGKISSSFDSATAVGSAELADRRRSLRRQGGYWANLLTLDGQHVIHCRCDNMGEEGLHFTAPVGYGFAVGQRYELLVGERDDSGQDRGLTGAGHYATVVRTRFHLGKPGDQVGVGLRFDQPIVL